MYKLSRGFDIKLKGTAPPVRLQLTSPRTFALSPFDVPGIEPIPTLHAREGESVLAGDPLFSSKSAAGAFFCSPVSGRVQEIRRGLKRAISEVVVEAAPTVEFREFRKPDLSSRESLITALLQSGAWPLLRQRPFDVLPNPSVTPRDIFISCFDTAPLAADPAVLLEGREEAFLQGLDALRRLTSGSVHLSIAPDSADLFRKAPGVKVHTFSGPHPAGAVGVQIHHVAPIAKGHIVWTIRPQDVAIIGTLVNTGIFDARRTVALTGAELSTRGLVDTRIGAAVAPWIAGNAAASKSRLISGDALTGRRLHENGHMGLFHSQLTVIEEGDKPEFLGWLLPTYPRPSLSRTFLSFLTPNREFHVNTNQHGEERAYVMTGQYERVVPMDLYPQHLVKAILCRDFDQMEGLGIYEVVEEDLALCEFVCTSKQPVQRILREGLNWIREEA